MYISSGKKGVEFLEFRLFILKIYPPLFAGFIVFGQLFINSRRPFILFAIGINNLNYIEIHFMGFEFGIPQRQYHMPAYIKYIGLTRVK